jgi:hypothetical protein
LGKRASRNEIRGREPFNHPLYEYPDYGNSTKTFEEWQYKFCHDAKSVAVATQIHRHTATCTKGQTKSLCRFKFGSYGKDLIPNTVVDVESGQIELKRGHALANNHSPMFSAVTRSNNDIKPTFISGLASLKSMHYMTSYVTKFEDDTSDLLDIKAAFEQLEKEKVLTPMTDPQERLRRLILRINCVRHGGVQFSAAQVAAMALNIGCVGI